MIDLRLKPKITDIILFFSIPCPKCKAPLRLKGQKFCMECGERFGKLDEASWRTLRKLALSSAFEQQVETLSLRRLASELSQDQRPDQNSKRSAKTLPETRSTKSLFNNKHLARSSRTRAENTEESYLPVEHSGF